MQRNTKRKNEWRKKSISWPKWDWYAVIGILVNVYEIANRVNKKDALLLDNNNGIYFSSALCCIIKGNLISFSIISFVARRYLLLVFSQFHTMEIANDWNKWNCFIFWCNIGGLFNPKILYYLWNLSVEYFFELIIQLHCCKTLIHCIFNEYYWMFQYFFSFWINWSKAIMKSTIPLN